MRRDFGGANARENKWSQDKADQPRHSRQQTFMENGDLNNPDFEEYYRAQVCVNSLVCVGVVVCGCVCVCNAVELSSGVGADTTVVRSTAAHTVWGPRSRAVGGRRGASCIRTRLTWPGGVCSGCGSDAASPTDLCFSAVARCVCT
jgi:hypothetical protein